MSPINKLQDIVMDRIVVIIPTYNRKLHLQQVLHNLSNQIIDDIELRILVAIDGSDDGTEEMIKREFPTVNYIKGSGDWWYTKSMNEAFAGVLRLFPDYVLTMNDDVKLSSNYVSELYQSIKKQNQPCIMGSVSVTESLPHQITFSGVRDIKWWRYQQVNYIQPFTVVDVSALKGVQPSKVLPGRGMLIPIRALKELNGFNETLPQYGSDDDFCLRAQKKGFRIYVNYKAVVYSHRCREPYCEKFFMGFYKIIWQ